MFGHKRDQEHEHGHERQWGWTAVAGTVSVSRLHHNNWTYLVDYQRSTGGTFRVTVPALPDQNVELAPGTPVRIEMHAKSGEGRLAAGQQLGVGVVPSAADALRRAGELAGHGDRAAAVAAALTGLGQAGLGQPGVPRVRVTGGAEVRIVGGAEVRVMGGAQAAEVMEAVQELMGGGDPAAAREKIRHLQADLRAQAGTAAPAEPEGFSSGGPSTFDSVTPSAPPPTTFSSPDPSVGQAGPVFGQPGFSPVAPATTFSSPASAGSFSAGSSFGAFGETKSDRIARLEDQRDRGQITPEQFAAQRQQIQDEI